jgi:hypothetical protein
LDSEPAHHAQTKALRLLRGWLTAWRSSAAPLNASRTLTAAYSTPAGLANQALRVKLEIAWFERGLYSRLVADHLGLSDDRSARRLEEGRAVPRLAPAIMKLIRRNWTTLRRISAIANS